MPDAYEVNIFDLAQLRDASIKDVLASPSPLVRATLNWLTRALQKKPGQGVLCLTCDTEFRGDDTWSVIVIAPFARPAKDATMVGCICPTCCAQSNMCDTAINRIRHGLFGGDLQILQPAST